MVLPLNFFMCFHSLKKMMLVILLCARKSYSLSLGLSLDGIKPLGNDIMEIKLTFGYHFA
jgi:hypothetical protein